jgi:hypothetical protein
MLGVPFTRCSDRRLWRPHDEVAMSFHLPPNEILVAFLLATLLIALAATPEPPPGDEPP